MGLGTGLPVQVHTLLDTPASAPIRVQASRLLRVRSFELKDHLGNIRVLVSDQKDANAGAQVQSYYNYYAFGMEMPNRTFDADKAYRYGFNGKENDKDFGTAGLTQDYGFRLYNPAIAKFLSVDPLAPKYPELTPYQFASNRPIDGIDLDGLEFQGFMTDLIVWYAKLKTGTDNLVQATSNTGDYNNSKVPQSVQNKVRTSQAGEGAKAVNEGVRDVAHVALATGGAVPVIGEPLDVWNSFLYAQEGKYDEAAFSMSSVVIPYGAGYGVKALATKLPMLSALKPVKQLVAKIQYTPKNGLLGKKVGHTFKKHGSHNTEELLHQTKNSREVKSIGQWIDDEKAEAFIGANLDKLKNGAIEIELPAGLGRVVNGDGTFTPATHAILVPSKTGVQTSYPTTGGQPKNKP